jgi:K+ transporter
VLLLLVAVFKSSSALAAAYGVAVTATMITTSLMALFVLWKRWHWPLWQVIILIVPLLVQSQAQSHPARTEYCAHDQHGGSAASCKC